MKDTYIIDWKNGEFSVETEPPGEGSTAAAEGPFEFDEALVLIGERGLVETSELMFKKP